MGHKSKYQTPMRKFLLISLILTGVAAAHAYDYPYLTFQASDGTTQSVSVESLTLTVNGGQLVAENSEGSATFTLTELSKMYFSATPTAITEISSSLSGNGVEVFSLSGIPLGRFDSAEQARSTLERGIYVVKKDGQTHKITVR